MGHSRVFALVVLQPITIVEVSGEWRQERLRGCVSKIRTFRDVTLEPGRYELEGIPNPAVYYYRDNATSVEPWLVLVGTENGLPEPRWRKMAEQPDVITLKHVTNSPQLVR